MGRTGHSGGSRNPEAKRTDIFVVGMDGIQPVYDLIRKDPAMAATVAYDVDRMGSTAVAVTALAIAGKELPTKLITLKPCLVDKQTDPPAGQEPDFKNCILFSGEEIKLDSRVQMSLQRQSGMTRSSLACA